MFLHLGTSPRTDGLPVVPVRHAEVLRSSHSMDHPGVGPDPFARAVRLLGHAAREELATPITSAAAEGLVRLFDDPRLAEELLS